MSKLDHRKAKLARMLRDRGSDGRSGKVTEEATQIWTEEDEAFKVLDLQVKRFNRGLPQGAALELRRTSLRFVEVTSWWKGATRHSTRRLSKSTTLRAQVRSVWPESEEADVAFGHALHRFLREAEGKSAGGRVSEPVQCPLCPVRIALDRVGSHLMERCPERERVSEVGLSRLLGMAAAGKKLSQAEQPVEKKPRHSALRGRGARTDRAGLNPKERLGCPLCGQDVLRKNLPGHIRARCSSKGLGMRHSVEELMEMAEREQVLPAAGPRQSTDLRRATPESAPPGKGKRAETASATTPKRSSTQSTELTTGAFRMGVGERTPMPPIWTCPRCRIQITLYTPKARLNHIIFDCTSFGPESGSGH